jgi:hypothetical protein
MSCRKYHEALESYLLIALFLVKENFLNNLLDVLWPLSEYRAVIHRAAAGFSNNYLQIIGRAGMLKEYHSITIVIKRPIRSIDKQTFS